MKIPVSAKPFLALSVVLAFAGLLPAQTNHAQAPVARLGAQAIYEEDLLPSIGAQLYQLKNQEYDLKIAALTGLLNQRLLEAEAKSVGLSTEALLEQNVDRNLQPASAAEIEAYYLAQKDRINKPLSEIRPQMEQALLQARRQTARQAWVNQLREKAGVITLLTRPKVDITADPARVLGNPQAAVTIVEFADFQCPYCGTVEASLKQVLDKYKGKVRLGFRDFPLRQIHPQAQAAAEASRCAADQGKFWEYHDLLFANQSKLDAGSLRDHAHTAGLDSAQFETCIASGKFRPMIDTDLQSGAIAGVSGTPAFLINGVLLSGAQPASAFEAVIDAELVRLASAAPTTPKDNPQLSGANQ
ncbi:MAG TPA: thioredoxin domain-containing protein [Bryobacteraceae bacterium]|nr:thioredoxin domain-containing protein [Bryobacteraceae bacterium]